MPAATDADGTIASYALLSGPASGSLTFNPDGTYSFNPGAAFDDLAAGATRDVTFTYTATDNDGGIGAPATVTITVTGTNDGPVATADALFTSEDSALTIPAATLLGNDTDIDGGTLSITSVQGAVNGTVALVGGNVVFTPAGNYNGPASFTYTVADGNGGNSTASVNITVTPVNDAPAAIAGASPRPKTHRSASTSPVPTSTARSPA